MKKKAFYKGEVLCGIMVRRSGDGWGGEWNLVGGFGFVFGVFFVPAHGGSINLSVHRMKGEVGREGRGIYKVQMHKSTEV